MSEAEKQAESPRWLAIIMAVIGIAFVIYQAVSALEMITTPNEHQAIHLGFALVLVFLLILKKTKSWLSILLALVAVGLSLWSMGYVFINCEWLEMYAGTPYLPIVVTIIGGILAILLLEGTRRSFGLAIPIVILVFLLYATFDHLIPGFFHGAYNTPQEILKRIGIGTLGVEGIFGMLLSVSANVIFLVFIYGALLRITGATRFFIQIGRLVGRRLAGGPALTAVVTSCMVGMVTGSIAANVAITGSFTIPLMKRVGYKPYQAGAIEATASTGGQIMPPIMGLVAFVLASITGIPYIKVIAAAAIPALLYFLSAGLYVQFQAMKMRASSMIVREEVEKVDVREMLTYGPLFIFSLVVLIILLVMGYSIARTMLLTTGFLVLLSLLRKETRPPLKQWIHGLTDGAVMGAQVGVLCGALGVLLGCLSLTGLLLKIPIFIVGFSGGNVIIALLLAMVASIILGAGSTTTVAYLLVALTIAPALAEMGLTTIQGHLFALYFAVMGFLTPPVAFGAAVGARMAGAGYMRTGVEATKVAAGGFIVPYLFVWCPALLLLPTEPLWAALGIIGSIALITAIQAVICGQYLVTLNLLERGIFALIALVMFLSFPYHSYIALTAGIILFMLMTIRQWRRRKLTRVAY